jgi:hypothetical protein
MIKTPKRPRDLNQWAKTMIDIATGETSDAPVEGEKRPAKSAPPKKTKSASRQASAKKE